MKISKQFTLATIGILAYMIADIIHEVIGHGITCLIIGNKIELLTSVYFKSKPGSILVDLGGPVANILIGTLTFFILKKISFAKFFFFQLTAYNLFWFSGTILHSALSKTGDWTFAIKEISISPYGKIFLIITGILCYVFCIQLLNSYLIHSFKENGSDSLTKQEIFYSFLCASFAAGIAGIFFKPDRLHAGFDGVLEMAASIPILFLKFGNNHGSNKYNNRAHYFFNFSVCILYIIFCLTLGKGISFVK